MRIAIDPLGHPSSGNRSNRPDFVGRKQWPPRRAAKPKATPHDAETRSITGVDMPRVDQVIARPLAEPGKMLRIRSRSIQSSDAAEIQTPQAIVNNSPPSLVPSVSTTAIRGGLAKLDIGISGFSA